MMKGIEVLLFDIGGVLVELGGMDIMHTWTDHRFSDDKMMEVWLQSPVVREFESGACDSRKFMETIVKEMKLPVSVKEFEMQFASWPTRVFPGVKSLLLELKKHYQLVSLSNTNQIHWPRIMQEMKLEPLFDFHFPSHLTGLLKPDSAAFNNVLDQLGTTPARVLFFDDNRLNINAAQKCGFKTVQTKGMDQLRTAVNKLELLRAA